MDTPPNAMDDTSLPPSLLALWKDLSRKQCKMVTAYCQKNQISIQDFIDKAVLEEERRYLTEHQAEPGKEWMRETLRNPIFRR
jgi:hypothetical protein